MTSGLDENAIIDFEEAWAIPPEDLVFIREIGRGAFGHVHKAEYLGLEVAVKQIDKRSMLDRDLEAEMVFLKREIALMKACRHPNIITFIGVVKSAPDEPLTQIVMEYMPRGDLRIYLSKPKHVIPRSTRIRMAMDIARAMLYLHKRKIVYRDLKSKNLMVDQHLGVKLTDFGFARAKASNKMQTMVGTEEFMAPEVLLGMDYGPSADIFSYGIVLFEIITREKVAVVVPRTPMNAFGLNEEKVRQSKLIPSDCPTEFSELAFSCCKYEPKERPSFEEILKILKKSYERVKYSSTNKAKVHKRVNSHESRNRPKSQDTTVRVRKRSGSLGRKSNTLNIRKGGLILDP
eukprot:TRINITY_DN4324_c0_g2_i1.p1 TRINITY_DN4324_c0_g2~~TRINITY_DN4324_c0_g2_i1.p1  ORF type:complete len:347 (+),score=44.08 TRINITY_DN4324_c0_g2_i1:59-1099(+)